MTYAIKAEIAEPCPERLVFEACKTMYGGKRIAPGDRIYLFASENEGGRGLAARGIVLSANPLPKPPGVDRWTPRVSIEIRIGGHAAAPLGRAELRPFSDWKDGRPETELNFKLYRQATNKIIGVTAPTAAFLATFFRD